MEANCEEKAGTRELNASDILAIASRSAHSVRLCAWYLSLIAMAFVPRVMKLTMAADCTCTGLA